MDGGLFLRGTNITGELYKFVLLLFSLVIDVAPTFVVNRDVLGTMNGVSPQISKEQVITEHPCVVCLFLYPLCSC